MFSLVGKSVLDGNKEKIIRVVHRHWFNILQQFFVAIVMFLLIFGGFSSLPLLFPELSQNKDIQRVFLLIQNTAGIFLWIFAFFIWIDFYLDIWIITEKKIINVEQKGIFLRRISELKFDRIQDVTVEVKGILPTLLNYGNIHIQTAGEVERFVFLCIPDPYALKNLIMNLQKETIAEETNELGEIIRKEIHDELS